MCTVLKANMSPESENSGKSKCGGQGVGGAHLAGDWNLYPVTHATGGAFRRISYGHENIKGT